MKKLHLCIVTGTRAEFGIWRPVIAGIRGSAKLKLSLVATGMHLQKGFGDTIRDIEAAGVAVAARVPMYKADEPAARSLARGVEGLAAAYREIGPDLVFLLGDRLEMLAAASAAVAERIPIAHLHGGETAPGIWDEQIRHAVTKMAHVHFCATKTAARRIRQMGEDPNRIHTVGAPGLDLPIDQLQGMRELMKRGRVTGLQGGGAGGRGPLLLLHPTSTDVDVEFKRARMIIRTLVDLFPEKRVQVLGPNNDPGHLGILRAYRDAGDRILLDMSMPQSGYWGMLLGSGLLVGNSSSGIIEAASFGVPVINIGTRQAGRERNANVIDVDFDRGEIEAAVRRGTTDRRFLARVARRENVYGDGRAAARIVRVLERLASRPLSLAKQFVS